MRKDIVITGYWDGQPIWRHKTPEEKLEEVSMKESVANLFIILQYLETYEK